MIGEKDEEKKSSRISRNFWCHLDADVQNTKYLHKQGVSKQKFAQKLVRYGLTKLKKKRNENCARKAKS